jgi:hypothetical protein
LKEVVMHWNAILFQLVYASTIYRPVCLFLYIKLSWNYKPSGVCQWGFSLSLQVMGKSWPHSAASSYLYLFVWANLCILFIVYFKLFFSNRTGTELKCKTGIRKTIYHWHYHTWTVGT